MTKYNTREKLVAQLLQTVGNSETPGSTTVNALHKDANGDVIWASGATVPSDGEAGYAKGCLFIDTNASAGLVFFVNEGSNSSCDFNSLERSPSEALTATADGLTTGLMTGTAEHVAVTSANAAHAITLPASSSALIGRTFKIWVGSNGFELLTPASSNATINGTDSDGTNQADIPANSFSRVTLVAANIWILENIGANGAVASAITPDND